MTDSSTAAVQQARAENIARKAALGRGPEMARVHTFLIPHGDDGVKARFLIPTTHPEAVFVYFHGGGWVLGSIDTFDRLGREIARRTGAAVLMVDYAKAPERPYPAAVEGAWAAYQWAVEKADGLCANLGALPCAGRPLVIGGDCAGGNLAAVVARRAAETNSTLDGQILVYPVTDCDLTRPGYEAAPAGRAEMATFWSLYDPHGRRSEPDASPLRAATLAGQAPALVLNAEHDPLNDEISAYAERLTAQGVPVSRVTLEGASHAVLSYWDTVPAASDGLDSIATWIRKLSRT